MNRTVLRLRLKESGDMLSGAVMGADYSRTLDLCTSVKARCPAEERFALGSSYRARMQENRLKLFRNSVEIGIVVLALFLNRIWYARRASASRIAIPSRYI